ncbi:MAG: S9 family peptidase [Flavobacteriaceae bacterium]|nr:S9 family peptidase [Flavobacteriaceae bacterium]
MRHYLFLIFVALASSCAKKSPIVYPQTKKEIVIDSFFGQPVEDPYRWLEDDRSAETEDWVTRQNVVTFNYLNRIKYRTDLEGFLTKLWNYEKRSTPFIEGDYTYFYKNDGLQNHYVLYRQKGQAAPEVFLDPNTFSEDGTTSLAGVRFTKDGSRLAYLISEGGSDWRKIIVMEAASKKIIEDTLINVKFSSVSWRGNKGFYYSSYDKPEGSELSAKTDQHKLYYHELGTPQSKDSLIFGGNPKEKHRYIGGNVSDDEHYLFISTSNTTSGNKLFMLDLENPKAGINTIIDHEDSDTYVLETEEDKLFLVTNLNAPNKKLVTAYANRPTPNYWRDLIPETENVLSISNGSNYFFAEYMIDALSKVFQYDYNGKLLREIKLAADGSAGGFSGKRDQKTVYYSFSNYHTPPSSFALNPKTGETSQYWTPEIDFDANDFESKQVFYTSKDGTKVPMMITYRKGLELTGYNPTILYGYGGFNISLKPSFSITNALWLMQGGIYAVPNLRGGGEYGKKWHNAGIQMKKQNVFDDFIAAAEYLIENKYTSPEYLAIRGGSNGGLLVGACTTQRPELFKVALPAVGVLDMLRYHRFTAGAGWSYDYGTADQSEEMFAYLKGYSPVHNVDANTPYPATLVTTGDRDDRVVPAHSFKFVAQLQANQSGQNPVLIRIETDAGHGAGTPVNKTIEQYADIFAFTLYNMGFKMLPNKK